AALDKDRVAYVVYGDYPAKAVSEKGAKPFLDAQTKGSVASLKGKLVSEKATLTLGKGKHPGREIVIALPEKGRFYRARIFLVGTRLYQVVAMGPEDFARGKPADRFLDSFKLAE